MESFGKIKGSSTNSIQAIKVDFRQSKILIPVAHGSTGPMRVISYPLTRGKEATAQQQAGLQVRVTATL